MYGRERQNIPFPCLLKNRLPSPQNKNKKRNPLICPRKDSRKKRQDYLSLKENAYSPKARGITAVVFQPARYASYKSDFPIGQSNFPQCNDAACRMFQEINQDLYFLTDSHLRTNTPQRIFQTDITLINLTIGFGYIVDHVR